jgi:Tol biopolymer transport system component
MKNIRFFLLCCFISMVLCVDVHLVSAQTPGVAKIAFASDRDGNYEIYLMNPDGSQQINLTHHPKWDYMPAFSPTGTQILFVSNRDGARDLYLMDTDGTNVRRVFAEKAYRIAPAWSPDGKWIAYQKGNEHDNSELYVASIGDRVEHRIAWVGHAVAHPSWSPDGTEIVFVVNVPFIRGIGPLVNTKLVFIDVQTRVEESFMPEVLPLMESPAWAPMGDKIAFSWSKLGLGQKTALFITNRYGQDVERVLVPIGDPALSEINPVWSPDGNQLAYEHVINRFERKGQKSQLFKIDIRSGKSIQLTHRGDNRDPDWFDPAYALPVQPQPHLLTTTWGNMKK